MDAHVELMGMIDVSPDSARRRAKRYLGRQVGMAIQSSDPVLVWQARLVWRFHEFMDDKRTTNGTNSHTRN